MRVLLAMNYFGTFFRRYETAITELLARGHEVHLGREHGGWGDRMGGERVARALRDRYPKLSWSTSPVSDGDPRWGGYLRQSRQSGDYLDALLAPIEDDSAMGRRARERAPDRVVELVEGLPRLLRHRMALRAAVALIDRGERAIPPNPALVDWIAEQDPDVVLMSPLLLPGSTQTEILRAAQALGLPTGLCVASWDNLSSKQRIRVRPDLVTVWNETQREEATTIQRLPDRIVETTGAQVYDEWFTWSPRPRREFCERVGLAPDRPYVLYAGGALYEAEITEAEFAVRWVHSLRSSPHESLRGTSVLFRPHPKRGEETSASGIGELDGVAVWPDGGRMPVEGEAKADFYDSLYHSAAVVGVNTSAMIEAGIVGRRVLAPVVPEFVDSQGRTLHFRYLTEVGGGLLQLSYSMDEHLDQLADAMAAGPDDGGTSREFVKAFVRPHGLDVPAAGVFADAVERLAERGSTHRPAGPVSRLVDRLIARALEPARARGAKAARQDARRVERIARKREARAVERLRAAGEPEDGAAETSEDEAGVAPTTSGGDAATERSL